MLAIFVTFSEAIRHATRHLGLIITLAIVDLIPFALTPVVHGATAHPSPGSLKTFAVLTTELTVSVVILILIGAKSAAIIGVLKEPASPWRSALSCIRLNTWTLVRVKILLGLVAGLFLLPVYAISKTMGTLDVTHSQSHKFAFGFMAIIYFIFAKYALTDPLVVLEKSKAAVAFEKSWEMTRGRFLYVLGCILALTALNIFVNSVLQHFGDIKSPNLLGLSHHFISDLIDSLSIFVAWEMYWRIKAIRATPPPFAPPPTQSPPESPSAS
jgi:hypothetical protein